MDYSIYCASPGVTRQIKARENGDKINKVVSRHPVGRQQRSDVVGTNLSGVGCPASRLCFGPLAALCITVTLALAGFLNLIPFRLGKAAWRDGRDLEFGPLLIRKTEMGAQVGCGLPRPRRRPASGTESVRVAGSFSSMRGPLSLGWSFS
jgi:hypothetical protein